LKTSSGKRPRRRGSWRRRRRSRKNGVARRSDLAAPSSPAIGEGCSTPSEARRLDSPLGRIAAPGAARAFSGGWGGTPEGRCSHSQQTAQSRRRARAGRIGRSPATVGAVRSCVSQRCCKRRACHGMGAHLPVIGDLYHHPGHRALQMQLIAVTTVCLGPVVLAGDKAHPHAIVHVKKWYLIGAHDHPIARMIACAPRIHASPAQLVTRGIAHGQEWQTPAALAAIPSAAWFAAVPVMGEAHPRGGRVQLQHLVEVRCPGGDTDSGGTQTQVNAMQSSISETPHPGVCG
jgi:hypothetical protein